MSKTVKSETLPFLQAVILPYFIHAGRRQKKPRLDKKQFITQYRTVRCSVAFLWPQSPMGVIQRWPRWMFHLPVNPSLLKGLLAIPPPDTFFPEERLLLIVLVRKQIRSLFKGRHYLSILEKIVWDKNCNKRY